MAVEVVEEEAEGAVPGNENMIILLFAAAAILVTVFILVYNALVVLRNRCRNSRMQVDSELKRRHDLIPRLVDAVRAYQNYEQETLTRAIDARSEALMAGNWQAREQAERRLDSAVRDMFVLIENNPLLKATESVLSLQQSLADTEDRIRFARQFLNDTVMKYNNYRQSFPVLLVALAAGFKAESYFEKEKS